MANAFNKQQKLSENAREALLIRLLALHGEILDAKALVKTLKFSSDRAFRRAVAKGIVPVSVFHISGKRGWCARTDDVASWLSQAGSVDLKPDPNTSKEIAMT